jgi:hypothetical protein
MYRPFSSSVEYVGGKVSSKSKSGMERNLSLAVLWNMQYARG